MSAQGHHITSIKVLLANAAALLVLTILTVAVGYVHMSSTGHIIAAMAIAVAKASLVALFFMNLYWDKRFNSMLFVASILFLALLVGLSLIDTLFRVPITPTF